VWTLKTITIVADDKVGLLADISYILAKSKINIETISVEVIAGKAVILMCLSDAEKGKRSIEAAGYRVENLDSIVIKISERPGELNKITTTLTKEGVDVKNVNLLTKDKINAIVAVEVDKQKRASTILKQYLVANDLEY
jgi:hypothetical protein